MARCRPHRRKEPCFYCKNGIQNFTTTEDHLDALEDRLATLFRQSSALPDISEPLGVRIKDSIAVIRDYALGDIVMLAPALKALKQKNLDRPLVLVTRPELYGVLEGVDYLDAQLPKSSYEHADFFRVYDLCGAVETEAGGKLPVKDYLTKPRPNIFAEKLGVPGDAKEFPIVVNQASLQKMAMILNGRRRPLIGLAPTCNSVFRTMPPEYVKPLVQKLVKSYGGTVVLMGKTNNWNQELTGIKLPNVLNLIDSLSVSELIAICSLMSAIISPDTGTMHVAGALGVKCLCLMGNNNPKNFSDFYESVKVLQPTPKELPCVPCNDRSIPCSPMETDQYGAECMRLMTPERVHKAFREFYNNKNIAYLHDTSLDFVGGAEITTKNMVKIGREMGYNVRVFNQNTPIEQLYSLFSYDLIVLSNIWRFTEPAMNIIMQAIRTVPYIKYEHDHDGLGDLALGKWPKATYAKKIYGNSALNIFVSPAHMADYSSLSNGKGVCIPELVDTSMFAPAKGVKRQPDTVLVGIPGKWSPKQIQTFIKNHADLKVDVLDKKVPHDEMPELYSQYEYFAHYPERKWPCDRVILEAALCGCKIMAGDIVEALSWDKDLSDRAGLKAWLDEVPGQFWSMVDKVVEKNG